MTTENDYEYVIVGDSIQYPEYKGSLIYVCFTKENAEKVLHRMLTEPDENDLYQLEKHTNLRIKATPKKDCWWNDPVLVR